MTETPPGRPAVGWAWAVYERGAMALGLGSLALMCLAWLPFAMLLHPVLPRARGQRLGRRVIHHGFRAYLQLLQRLCACRFDFHELAPLRHQGPLIVAANHPSLLDAVILVAHLPNAVCVMKASLMDRALFGAAARLARYIRNDGILQLIGHSGSALAEGAQLVLFPEGSRTQGFPVDALAPTLGMIARRARLPVQTVVLDYSSAYLGKRWPLFQPPRLPLRVRARLGRRFDPPADYHAFTAELQAWFQQQVQTPAP